MLKLNPGKHGILSVHPRWPDKFVLIDPVAKDYLSHAQTLLPENLQLVLTRGYQPETWLIRIMRKLGRHLFCLLFPKRRNEASAIFLHNGHASDGTHIDLSIELDSRRLNFLPFSVFTAMPTLLKRREKYRETLNQVCTALKASGFSIHFNIIEASQIHCDLQR